jgi:hypothetical protein
MSGNKSKMNGKSFSKLSSNEKNAVKALLNMGKGTMKSRRNSMFAPRPGQAKKPGKKLTTEEEKEIGQRFFHPKGKTWGQCFGAACTRGSKIAGKITKKTLSMAGRFSRSVAGKGKSKSKKRN